MKISDTDLEKLNEDLALHFGMENNKPKYRISFSAGQLEKRQGTFRQFYHGLFLREVSGVFTVPKYLDSPPRYKLERLFFMDDKELVEARDGIYEGIWDFISKDDIPLPPKYEVAATIIKFLEGPKVKRTESDDIAEEEKLKQEEIDYFTNYLDDIGQSSLFYQGAGTFIDSRKSLKDKE